MKVLWLIMTKPYEEVVYDELGLCMENGCVYINIALLITLVVIEIGELWLQWNHDINVWCLVYTCDCDVLNESVVTFRHN